MGPFPATSDTNCCSQTRDQITRKALFGLLEPRLVSGGIVSISAEEYPKVLTDGQHDFKVGEKVILDVGAGGLFNNKKKDGVTGVSWKDLGLRILTVNATGPTWFRVHGATPGSKVDMRNTPKLQTIETMKAYTACQSYTMNEIVANECYDKDECTLDMDPSAK